ncbi:MAG: ORF6N domain-containing protein [Bacilli bacterium]|nr:ORF6N domain-containing protein [Bacilli bacterium]
MNNIVLKEETNIENMIYEIRGRQVMLDSDLAKLYKCKNGTKTLNLAVKRHINRFPERFMFKLTREEYYEILRFQSETLELEQGKYSKYLPYVFTEQGVAMLATVLKTEVAEEISIKIMDAFIALRRYISDNLIEQKFVNKQVLKNTEDIKLLKESFQKFEEKRKVNEIYFNGKIYDAYSKIIDIFSEAKKELIIVDRYTDKTILDMIKNLKSKVILITSAKSKLTSLDIEKYNDTYSNLMVIFNDTFHDRYIIIDKNKIYHSGNSINHIGYRKSSINVLEDRNIKETILNDIKRIIINYNIK